MSGFGTIYDNLMAGLTRHSQTLARLQEQIASGSRVLRASDDPTASSEIIALGNTGGALESCSKNLGTLMSNLDMSSSMMQQISELLVSVKVMLTDAASGTCSQTSRNGTGLAIGGLIERAIGIANTKVTGRYLFGGDAALSAPYEVVRSGGRIVAVNYRGSSHSTRAAVSPGVEYESTIIGKDVFGGDGRGQPVFLGNTGAAPGRGTSSVKGDVWLTVAHGTTTYAGATGVAAGATSAAGDTIIGTSHLLTIDADNKTVHLDNGQQVSYDPAVDDDLRVENATGEVVYVNMTGLDAGLSGTVQVAITATGKLSIDDMAGTVDLTAFSDNEAVTDSRTGRVLYVDARQIVRTGTEPIRVPGTYDMFAMLINARDLLLNERDLSADQQGDLIAAAIDSIEEVMVGVTSAMTTTGGRLQAMAALQTTIAEAQSHLDIRTSALQDTDIVQVAVELARVQTHYQMMLGLAARVLSLSLMDFL